MAPFTRISEVEVHRGLRFVLARARYRAADGTEFERDIVHHPGAVGIVPFHDDGTVTLVRQFRAALGTDLVEIPAGLRDVEGEADRATAARELVEEAGLEAAELDLLATFHNSPGYCDESVAIYLATGLTPVADDRQGAEEQAMTVERLPLAEALAWVDDGRITDAKTIIGLSTLARRSR
ncbi:MAG: NUDIX hydrolase [Acidimicrobiales bacterium]|nr:NUDIX hydrolase [Acidimicrobiales bacterium]